MRTLVRAAALLVAGFVLLACSDEEESPPTPGRTPGTAAVDPFEAHVSGARESLAPELSAQLRRVLALAEDTAVDVEWHESKTSLQGEGHLVYRAIVRLGDRTAVFSGRQIFHRDGETWRTEWANGTMPPEAGEFRTADCWIGRTPGSWSPVAGRAPGGQALGGEFGGEARSRLDPGQGVPREQALGLKDLDSAPQPLMKLLGTADPQAGLSPEERTRWEWLETRPDLSLVLVPERTESSGRTFGLGAVRFPPSIPAYEPVRLAAATAIEARLAGRLLTLRRSGDDLYQVETPEGSINLFLVDRGLALADPVAGAAISDPERRALLDSGAAAAEAGRGLWEIVSPRTGEWICEDGLLHRPPCPAARSGEPAIDPVVALRSGAQLCSDCLARAADDPTPR